MNRTRHYGFRARAAAAFTTLFGLVLSAGAAHAAPALEGYRPFNETSCVALRDQLESTLKLSPAFITTPNAEVDFQAFGVSSACRLELKMSGVLFETETRFGFAEAEKAMREAMNAAGWSSQGAPAEIAADGPFATVYALAKDKAVCLIEVEFSVHESAPPPSALSDQELRKISIADRRYRLAAHCLEP